MLFISHNYTYIPSLLSLLPLPPFHPSRSSQSMRLGPLCYTATSHQLSILYMVVYIWEKAWHPTPVLLPGKSHGRRSLVGCGPWGHEELDMTEWLQFHFSLSRTGEGNGNPLQCSCLENPKDRGAWWIDVYGVAQSQTWLKWLSNSSVHMLILLLAFIPLSPSPTVSASLFSTSASPFLPCK